MQLCMGHLNSPVREPSHAEAGSLSSGSRGHSTELGEFLTPGLHVHSSSVLRARSMHVIAINNNEKSATIQPLPGGMDPFLRTGAIPISSDSACTSRRSLPRLTELITTRPHGPPPSPGSCPLVCSPSKTRANVHVLIRGCRSPSQKTSGTLPPFPFLCEVRKRRLLEHPVSPRCPCGPSFTTSRESHWELGIKRLSPGMTNITCRGPRPNFGHEAASPADHRAQWLWNPSRAGPWGCGHGHTWLWGIFDVASATRNGSFYFSVNLNVTTDHSVTWKLLRLEPGNAHLLLQLQILRHLK